MKDTRLGIEGTHWLRKLLQNSAKEPATAALGGIPIGLKAAIEKELELIKYVLIYLFINKTPYSLVQNFSVDHMELHQSLCLMGLT